GGNGCVSFRREAHVPRGGPDGGDGGRGGDVVLVADASVRSLLDVQRHPHQRASAGTHGQGDNKTGAAGDDRIVRVPVGTLVRDPETGEVLADLVRPGQRAIVATGGRGGRGNASFKNRFRRVPRFAERGEPVTDRTLRLELKLIADVGLVGWPSAGKSSLIRRLSNAQPRVEEWPFTTLTPHLGVMRAGDDASGAPIDVVLADVPGLIEGASEGRGLGHQFLRHIERCRVLLHVVDAAAADPERDPVSDLAVIRRELAAHDSSMLSRPQVVALNKLDLPDAVTMADMVESTLVADGDEVFRISTVTGEGLDALRYRLGEIVARARASEPDDQDATDEVLIRLLPEARFDIGVLADGTWRVSGTQVERWIAMLPLDNPDAVRYLQGRLRRAGVDRALVEAGARDGDDVVIGDVIFEFEPELDDLPAEEREAILAAEQDDFDDQHDHGGLTGPEEVGDEV
ncbi:MAG: GTPase ObgE, partial [Nitriliruptorales bacterium]|nr:GTPase ObgE [Nitriliruptorales bacterium]